MGSLLVRGKGAKALRQRDEQGLCPPLLQAVKRISKGTHHPMWPRCHHGVRRQGYQFRNGFRGDLTKEHVRGIKTYGFPYDLMSSSFIQFAAQHTILQSQILRAVATHWKSKRHMLLSLRFCCRCRIKTLLISSRMFIDSTCTLSSDSQMSPLRSQVRG